MIGPNRVSYDLAVSRHADRLEQAAARREINETRRAATAGTRTIRNLPLVERVAGAAAGILAALHLRQPASQAAHR